MEDTVFTPSQGAAGDIHPPSIYEIQLLQMFVYMKDEITKQQILFDHEREQATRD